MKRGGMWFFLGFVLAILLTLCPRPGRRTGVFLDPPIGRAHAADCSRLVVLAVDSAEPSLHLEARRSPVRPDECLALLYNFSLEHVPLRADDIGPPGIDPRRPPVLVQRVQRSSLQGPPVPPGAPEGGYTTLGTRENWGSCKNRGFATCNFATGFS